MVEVGVDGIVESDWEDIRGDNFISKDTTGGEMGVYVDLSDLDEDEGVLAGLQAIFLFLQLG